MAVSCFLNLKSRQKIKKYQMKLFNPSRPKIDLKFLYLLYFKKNEKKI